MRTTTLTIILVLLVSTVLVAGGAKESHSDQKPVVAVSILPQAFFVDRLASGYVTTVTLVGEGQNPHSYEPTPSQMAQLAQAKVWLFSGTEFELALKPKIAKLYPNLRIIDTTEGMTFRALEEDDHHHHHGGDDLNIDRHTWLGHSQALILLKHTEVELLRLVDPEEQEHVRTNAETLRREIDHTFSDLETQLAAHRGRTVFVYHPSFGYFFDSFGLIQAAVETGGKEPTARDLERLISAAQEARVQAIFVQKQFPASSAQRVAHAIGAQVVPLDPLAYEWLENIRLMGQIVGESYD